MNSDRQIFIKLAVIGQARDIDIHDLLCHELSPVPLSLFNLDGTYRKTMKSATMSWMERDHSVPQLPLSDSQSLLVIDFMMLIHMMCTDGMDCATFGDLSENLLHLVLSQDFRFIAVVADCYLSQSIKGGERARRSQIQMHEIRNPTRATPLPKQRNKMLSNPANKANLASFLMCDWMDVCQERLPEKKTLFLAGGFDDAQKVVAVDHGNVSVIEELFSDHEEADSRMFIHISHAVTSLGVNRVVLWSCDSDVAAMCPRYAHLTGVEELFFKTGTRNKRRYIPMHIVAQDLGYDISLVLPSVHAVSGSDSTSAFCGVGKRKWMKSVAANADLLRDLQEFGQDPASVSDVAMTALVNLTSLVYANKRCNSLNALRYELFTRKNASSEKLPPTMDAFTEHIKRANYQSFIWLHATQPFLRLPSPNGNGWKIGDTGDFVSITMTSAPAPKSVLALSECHCKANCATRQCHCRKEGLVCSDVCGCDNEYCTNRLVGFLTDSSDDES